MFTINYRKLLHLGLLCVISFSSLPYRAVAEDTYMGVGSCSSSNCHGNTNPRLNSDILHNEFVTWFKQDKHSQAYKILYQDDAKKIAANMGLGDPIKEKLCLDCHAVNAPKNKQGDKFYLEDGISCEKCHGAAERWLAPHSSGSATHSSNVTNGMTDLTNLTTRVNLCTGCHFGTADTVATHNLIGSGHPRLTFELDTFEAVQPRHWKLDADYTKRKGAYNSTQGWLLTEITLAEKTLEKIMVSHAGAQDLSNYYCYSCHHSLDENQWRTRNYKGRAGELRFNDAPFILLAEGLKKTDADLATQIAEARERLNEKTLSVESAQRISEDLKEIRSKIVKLNPSERTTRAILDSLLAYGRSGQIVDYQVADQMAMAIETLGGKNTAPLFASLKASYAFKPENFKRAISSIR